MATYKINEKHEHLICPYNNLHVVEAYRFQRHLMKCKKFYPEKDYAHCSFNYTHVVLRSELGHHHTKCPDRARINDSQRPPENEYAWNNVVEDEGDTTIQAEENWNDDAPAVLQKLGGDGFKPVRPRNRKSERPVPDVEGWLSNQVTPQDVDWEPEEEVRLPNTMSRVMASGLTQVPPKPQNHPKVFSMAMAAAGRGQIMSSKSVPKELLALGRGRGGLGRGVVVTEAATNGGYSSSSDSSGPSCPSPKTIRLSTPGGSPRGRGRASVKANRLRSSPGSGDASSNSSEPDTGIITRENVPVPLGLSRIAASLGQQKAPLGRGRGRPLQETSNDAVRVNGLHMDPEEKQKNIRKLKKKLSEIQILKKQQDGGKVLDDDQLAKITNAENYRKELEALSAN